MNRARHVIRIVGALLLGVAVAGAPALTYAQHSAGGGGGGGGGHFSGGGGHFGGGSHVMGGGGHFYGGGHAFAAPHFGGYAGPHYFAAGRVGAPGHYVYPGHSPVYPGHLPGVHPGAPYAPGSAYWHGGHAWVGGYWHGAYWPHVWFYPGYAWYLPVLPLGYATFWWGGVPYYYWNNLYYTWNPANNGYVVTDPPPAGGDNTPIDPSSAYDQGQGGAYEQTQPPPDAPPQGAPEQAPAPPPTYSAPAAGSAGDVYLYPRNGQSEAQQQNDRYECHSWAVNQTGFDPTRGQQQQGNEQEYRRAMVACLDARGYSAR